MSHRETGGLPAIWRTPNTGKEMYRNNPGEGSKEPLIMGNLLAGRSDLGLEYSTNLRQGEAPTFRF